MSRFVQAAIFAFLLLGSLLGDPFLTNAEELGTASTTIEQTPTTRLSLMPRSAAKPKTLVGSETVQVKSLGGELLKGTLYCIAIFLFGASLYKRYLDKQQNTAGNGIEIVSRRALGSRTALLVVRAEGRRFFLSQSGEEVHLLTALDEPASFERQLAQFASVTTLDELPTMGSQQSTVNG